MTIVALTPDRDHYITPIASFLDFPLTFQRNIHWESFMKKQPKAIIVIGDWTYDLSRFIQKCRKNRIPSILMMDGTIEWKHFFENPKWSFGGNEAPYFPVFCDKVLVPGASTYRFLDYFENHGKCELTGLPRFDHYYQIGTRNRQYKDYTVGIMSANTAGYTHEQIEETKQLFEDLHNYFQRMPQITVKWRVRKGFEKDLPFQLKNSPEEHLSDFLHNVDAVICQPSTAAYEAMIFDKPVALADYSIAPNYMQAAWQIKSKDAVEKVIPELLNPQPLKVNIQRQLLDDTLAYIGSSSRICGSVINAMIKHAHNLPPNEWHFPTDMALNFVKEIPMTSISHPTLFSNRKYFELDDNALLKELLLKAEKKIEAQATSLKRRSLGFWMEKALDRTLQYLKNG